MMMLKPLVGRLARRPWRFIFPGLLVFFLVFTLSRRTPHSQPPVHKTKTKSFFPPLESKSANSIELDYCQNFPVKLLDEIQVVLKVASSEASTTKAHLSTVSSCITNLIIAGDSEERLGDRHIIDILAELPKSYETNNPDFKAYVEQKKAHTEGETVKEQQRAFKLDRFKYLPMVDKAYAANPTAKWFVFLESDVYFFWDTLFRLLSQLDAAEPHYLGAPHKGSDGRWFAYGGAGIVLSQGLLKQLIPAKTVGAPDVAHESKLATRFESWVKEEQRGDAVLAYAIQNATGHKLQALYPTFASDPLKTVTTTRDRWCVPMLSLHQLKPEEMENLWKWERTRQYNTKPFTYSSLLSYTHSFLSQGPSREWWDNLSTAPVPNDRPAHRNAGSCGSECAADNNCLQWSYSQTVCRHADYIKLGDAVDRENGGQGEFVSGWDTGKLQSLGFGVEDKNGQREFYAGCDEATWLTPQIMQN
ncbi:hypothetical protein IAQ61_007791 [Plenodomus lingam]|nr:hypothetical protein IAQ61_007791 [Plenodomus lingam]